MILDHKGDSFKKGLFVLVLSPGLLNFQDKRRFSEAVIFLYMNGILSAPEIYLHRSSQLIRQIRVVHDVTNDLFFQSSIDQDRAYANVAKHETDFHPAAPVLEMDGVGTIVNGLLQDFR